TRRSSDLDNYGETEDYLVKVVAPSPSSSFLQFGKDLDASPFNDFTYYPNLVKNRLSLQSSMEIDQVVIYNMFGKAVLKTTPQSMNAHIGVENFPEGIYLMKIRINGKDQSFKIVKK